MEDLATTQWGAVSRAQLLALGFSEDAIERRVRSRRLKVVHPCTFVLAGSPQTWEQQVTAAVLWAGPQAVISHRAAAAIWRLEGFDRPLPEITTTRSLRPTAAVVVYRKKIASRDVRTRNGFRVTSIPRTLLDVAAVCTRERAERALEGALHERLTHIGQLQKQLDAAGGRGVRGSRLFRELIEQACEHPRAESRLERKLGQLLARIHPTPVAQYEVMDGGKVIARLDFAYPDKLVAVESDGYRFHGARRPWQADLQRHSALARLGWRVLRYTWQDVTTRPEWILDEVLRALDAS